MSLSTSIHHGKAMWGHGRQLCTSQEEGPDPTPPCWSLTLVFPAFGFVRTKCLFSLSSSLWYLLWLPELTNTPYVVKSLNIHSTREGSVYLGRSHLFPQLDWEGDNNAEIQLLNFPFIFLYYRLVWPLAMTHSQIVPNHKAYEEAVMIIQRIYFSTPGSIHLITL